jgi:hypothetical protein
VRFLDRLRLQVLARPVPEIAFLATAPHGLEGPRIDDGGDPLDEL